VCLGESTTANQYPHFLEEALNQRNTGIKFTVIDKGFDGTKTWIILSKLESNLNAYHPDMVVTMMGINDCGLYMPYELVSDSKAINFLSSFRIYKLTRLIWLHIVNRLKESKFYKLSNNDGAYVELAMLYRKQGKSFEAEESFKKAIELNPRNDSAYTELARLYREQGESSEIEELCKKAIELNPRNDSAYTELGRLYQEQGKSFEAEESFKKAIELNPRNDMTYGALEVLCIEMGNMGLARKYGKEVRDLRLNYYSLVTASNYHELKTILDKRGITYLCVQYPLRNLEPLKKILQGNDKGIIFVDNEKIFKDAVAKYGYKNYFIDRFGGDFGHCTPKGNRLLAENIANAILKEVFHK